MTPEYLLIRQIQIVVKKENNKFIGFDNRAVTKALNGLLGTYWYTMQSALKRLSKNEDWFQEARTLFIDFILGWDLEKQNFRSCLYNHLRLKARSYEYKHITKIKKKESFGSEEFLSDIGSPPNYLDEGADLKWLRYKIFKIMKQILNPIELEILIYEFFTDYPQKYLCQKLKLTQPALAERKRYALEKLRKSSQLQELWNQSREMFL